MILYYKLALGYSSILTGLLPFGDNGFSWNGITVAQGLEWAKGSPSKIGECTTFNKMGLQSTPCQNSTNFMCEAKADQAKHSHEYALHINQ